MQSECPECGGKIGTQATKCRCGWKMPGTAQATTPKKTFPCCFDGCIENAICSIFTDTGWANVCLTHYPKVKRSSKSYCPENLAVKEGRRAYEASPDYRRRHGIARPAKDNSAFEAELAAMRARMAAHRDAGEEG